MKASSKYVFKFQDQLVDLNSLETTYEQFYRTAGQPFINLPINHVMSTMRAIDSKYVDVLYNGHKIEIEQAPVSEILSVLKMDPNFANFVKDEASAINKLL